jgi:peptidyl-prolyl cis-trans isomerase D
MSIIQDIRDKYAKVTVVLIALALVGFILTDYFQGKARSGGGSTSNSIGTVNGRNINYDDFSRKVEANKQAMKAQAQQQGYPVSPAMDQQATEQTWGQEVSRLLLEEELDNLGINVGKKEMGDVLYGANAPADIKRQFTDSATGQFDAAKAKSAIESMLKSKQTSPEQKAQFIEYINNLELQRKADKYISLLANSVNEPRWYVEKQNADASQMAKVSFVNETYASIADSTIKVEDKDIADYISKHKDLFKQDESRSISYLTFSASPSAKDSATAREELLKLKAAFDSTNNLDLFFLNQTANSSYYKGYINGKAIQIGAKDSIFRTPVGSVYGPYLDGNNYSMARVEGVTQMPDTAKVRHILISTQGRDSATARQLADSIANAIAKGANFDSLCAKFSEDPGSKDKGGVYDNVTSGQMVPPFNDFMFLKPVGTKGVVNTDFGSHYMEVLSQKGGGTGYKIAYISKEIITSKETDATAQENALKFEGDSKDIKTFDAVYEKEWKAKGYNKGVATDITPSASEIRGVGVSRAFVKAIYAARKGEVLKPELIDNNYIVAVVTDVQEEGTMSVAKARPYIESILRNKKKAEQLKKKAGAITTLEAAATAFGGKQIITADSIRMEGRSSNPKLGYEPRVIGAAFNPANKGKVVPEALEGANGVYVVRVDDVTTTPVTNGDVASQRKARIEQQKQNIQNQQGQSYPLNTLRAAATIKDRRSRRM